MDSPGASSDWLLWDGILGGLCLGILNPMSGFGRDDGTLLH